MCSKGSRSCYCINVLHVSKGLFLCLVSSLLQGTVTQVMLMACFSHAPGWLCLGLLHASCYRRSFAKQSNLPIVPRASQSNSVKASVDKAQVATQPFNHCVF